MKSEFQSAYRDGQFPEYYGGPVFDWMADVARDRDQNFHTRLAAQKLCSECVGVASTSRIAGWMMSSAAKEAALSHNRAVKRLYDINGYE